MVPIILAQIGDAAMAGGVVAVALALIKIIDKLIEKKGTAAKNAVGFGAADREALHVLREQHGKVDADGVPLWYVPRSIERTMAKQNEILEALTKMIDIQNRLNEERVKVCHENTHTLRSISRSMKKGE